MGGAATAEPTPRATPGGAVGEAPGPQLLGRSRNFVDRRYRRLFADPGARRRHGPRLVPRIDRQLWQLAAIELSLDLGLGRALRRLKEGSRYRRLGFPSWRDYVYERLGIEQRWSQYLIQLDRGCERVGELREALERGVISTWKALLLLRVMDGETPVEERQRWIARAARLSVRKLEREIKQEKERMGKGASGSTDERLQHPSETPPGRWLEFRVPARTAVLWPLAVETVRRLSNSNLPVSRCLEYMIAERLSASGWPEDRDQTAGDGEEGERVGSATPGAGKAEATTSALERLEAGCEAAAKGWQFLCWQRQALGLEPEVDPMIAGNPWELDRIVESLEGLRKEIRRLCGQLLEAMVALKGWRLLGFASAEHYARERLGLHPKQVERLIGFEQALGKYPSLARAYAAGQLSYLQTLLLLRVVHPSTVDLWVAWGRKKSCRAIERVVEQAQLVSFPGATPEMLATYARALRGTTSSAPGGGERRPVDAQGLNSTTSSAPGERREAGPDDSPVPHSDPDTSHLPLGIALPPDTFLGPPRIVGLDPRAATVGLDRFPAFQRLSARIRLFCPDELLPLVRAGLRSCTDAHGLPLPHWRALDLLIGGVLERLQDPDIKQLIAAFPILDRDGWHCRAPTCSQRAHLHPHHIWRQGDGGPDEPWNQITVCASHHLAQIHGIQRSVTVSGPTAGRRSFASTERTRSIEIRHGSLATRMTHREPPAGRSQSSIGSP
jgi:hypothetical protein